MKLMINCSIFLCAAVIVFAYWSIFNSYLSVNKTSYLIQKTAAWKLHASTDTHVKKTSQELIQSYSNLTICKDITIKPIFYNKSTPETMKSNSTLYIVSAIIHHGNLGNKMFKYASMLGMAVAQGRKMFIQRNAALQNTFKIKNVGYNGSYENWTTVREANLVSFDPKLMNLPLENVKLHAYLQSFVYFSNITDLVREEFTFLDHIANAAAAIVSDVRVKYRTSLLVGVHVRRGDFLEYKKKRGFGVASKSYFLKAFDWMRATFPGRNITFLVASDDLPWCKYNLAGSDVVLMPPATPSVHMAVLASCDHVIISGGTFGWWSGWLAGGKVIYYKGYMAPGTSLGKLLTPETYYPRLWIGMDD